MKVAPVSADLLIKLALGAALVGGLLYAVGKGRAALQGAIDTVTGLPGRLADSVVATAKEGGATYQGGYTERPPSQQDYYGKYTSPMVNDQGYDFSQLSG